MALSADDFLSSELFTPENGNGSGDISSLAAISQVDRTLKKDYRAAYIYINVTSSSQRSIVSECARKFQIFKNPVGVGEATGANFATPFVTNVDFVYGHSVGAGVQTYLTTRNKSAALFACFLGWNTDYDASFPKKGKNSSFAALAVEKFIHFWETTFGDDWEIAIFNGKPASELTFIVDCENGYYHAGHIDIVLRHKTSGRYMVLELKTTASRVIDEAQYGNQEQSLGYSIVVDKVAQSLDQSQQFEVLYLVYSTTMRTWNPFTFTKSRTQRMEWLQHLLLDHTLINTYVKLGFFPKNGDACWSFNKRCPHFGLCDMKSMQSTAFKTLVLKEDHSNLPEKVDFFFTLSDLTGAAMRGNLGPSLENQQT